MFSAKRPRPMLVFRVGNVLLIYRVWQLAGEAVGKSLILEYRNIQVSRSRQCGARVGRCRHSRARAVQHPSSWKVLKPALCGGVSAGASPLAGS